MGTESDNRRGRHFTPQDARRDELEAAGPEGGRLDMSRRPRRYGTPSQTSLGEDGRIVLFWVLGLAAAVLVGTCGVFLSFFIMRPRDDQPPPPAVGGQPGVVRPLPIDPAWDEKTMQGVYLSDLPERDASVGWGKFGKNGLLGFGLHEVREEDHRIIFGGKPSPKGLSTHPPTAGSARAKYDIGGVYKLLRGTAAMADLPPAAGRDESPSEVTFHVLGDGQALWSSRPLRRRGDAEPFRLSVAGVRELELRASCAAEGHYTWAVWLDPYLLR